MKTAIFTIILWIFLIVGEIQCIYKFIKSDFEPSYKREIVYGISMCTGLGCIIGWFNIEDGKATTN